MTLNHVSDTALLVAAARAIETARPDGLVRDPYAAMLAGHHGMALAGMALAESGWNSLGIGMRSRFIDELLPAELSRNSTDCVLSLGAGLDSRPWRLDLPANLRWIEVDFEPILDYKYTTLREFPPRCRLERLTVDLNDTAQRQAMLAKALPAGSRALLLTEGLLIYLPASTVTGLAREAFSHSPAMSWVLDVMSAAALRSTTPLAGLIESLGDKTRLSGEEILRTLTGIGWVIRDRRAFLRAGATWLASRAEEHGHIAGPPIPKALAPNDPTGIWLVSRG